MRFFLHLKSGPWPLLENQIGFYQLCCPPTPSVMVDDLGSSFPFQAACHALCLSLLSPPVTFAQCFILLTTWALAAFSFVISSCLLFLYLSGHTGLQTSTPLFEQHRVSPPSLGQCLLSSCSVLGALLDSGDTEVS